MSNAFHEEIHGLSAAIADNTNNHHLNENPAAATIHQLQLQQQQLQQTLHHPTAQDLADVALMMALPVGVPLPAPMTMGTTAAATQQQQQPQSAASSATNRHKRLCRFPGCTKVIKSQGHCQRHGARAKRCRVEGCEKQAQGTHDGMCKRHWKAEHMAPDPTPPTMDILEPVGDSAYDYLIPRSIAYRPVPNSDFTGPRSLMPLVVILQEGFTSKEPGWHRNQERAARGFPPIENFANHFETWERQLVLVEILLLSGGTPCANFRHLAHAWGRERGFHNLLINTVCTRRGEVDRKRRSDAKEQEGGGEGEGEEEEEEDQKAGLNKRPRQNGDDDHEDDNAKASDNIYLQAVAMMAGNEGEDQDDQDEEEDPSSHHKRPANTHQV